VLQIFAPDLGVNQAPHALAVVILVFGRLEVRVQGLDQQTGQFFDASLLWAVT
jgi:hypothetical protein